MEEKVIVPDFNDLALVFLETIRDISKSGNVLNPKTIAEFLAKKHKVRLLMHLANRAQKFEVNESRMRQRRFDLLESGEDSRDKQSLQQMIALEAELDMERDANKRAALLLISLASAKGNESLVAVLEEYKNLVVDEADLMSREQIVDRLQNLLKERDMGAAPDAGEPDGETPVEAPSKIEKIRQMFSDVSPIKMKPLQTTTLRGLRELADLLGDEFAERISVIEDRVKNCKNFDYLLSLRKQIVGIVEEFIDKVRKERAEFTRFMKVVGDRLIEMEAELYEMFAVHSDDLVTDRNFHGEIEQKLKGIGNFVEGGESFEAVKQFIVGELARLGEMLDQKRQDYDLRLIRMSEEREKMQQHFETMVKHVMEENKLLVERNQKDPLTGIYNRGTFDEMIAIEFQRFRRYEVPFSIIIFDIDHFKAVNDTYGHPAGDKVLRGIAAHIGSMLRKTDLFCRYGGEEFAVLMPNTDSRKGSVVGEKLRLTVEGAEFLYEGTRVPITVSVGVTEALIEDDSAEAIMKRADQSMYQAKKRGRNTLYCDVPVEA